MRSRLVSVALFSILCFCVIPQVFAGSVSKVSFATVTLADGSHSIQDLFKVTGVPPWDVESVAITPPEGMDSQVISNLRYNFSYTSAAGTILGPLLGSWLFPIEDGNYDYDFKLSDGSSLISPPISTDYLRNDLPVVDAAQSIPNDEYTGITTPTLSWVSVDDSLYYRVVIVKFNEPDFKVWTSELITPPASMSVIVPSDILSENDAYRWFVEAYDSDSLITAQNISRSESNRFYTGNFAADFTFVRTVTNSRVRPDRYEVQLWGRTTGPAPWDAQIVIEGNNATDSFSAMLNEGNYYDGNFYYSIRSSTASENLADQDFTFTVTDNRPGATASPLEVTKSLTANWIIPFHKIHEMYQVPEEGHIYTTTPTFSWEVQSGVVEYRLQMFSYGNYRFYWASPWASDLSVEVPAGILKKDSAYQWRVETRDSNDISTANRGRGEMQSFFIADDKLPLSVSGQITAGDIGIPSGTLVHIEATDSPDWPGGTKFSLVKIFPSSFPADYTLHNIPRGQEVFFHAFWDKDGSESITVGDYKGTFSTDTPVTGDVPPETDTNINLSTKLLAASSLGGTITCSNWVFGYGNIYIAVLDDSGEPITGANTSIASPGVYTVVSGGEPTVIPVGGYVRVQAFWDTDSSGGLTPTDQVLLSDEILVTSSTTVDLDIGTQVPISGKVLKADGTPVVNLTVYVADSQTGHWVENSHTDSDGFYYISVVPGDYKVGTCSSCWNDEGIVFPYLNVYYNDATTFDKAEELNTSSGVFIDINFTLEDPVEISGVVKDLSDNLLANIPMQVQDQDGNGIGDWVLTDNDGYYSIVVASETSYYVRACPQCEWGDDNSTQPYIDKYYGDVDPWEDGAVPNVDVGTDDVPNIDFSLEGAFYISGRVTDSNGNPLANIEMSAEDGNTNGVAWDETDNDGYYSLAVASDSSYYVRACPQCGWDGSTQPYLNMYYNNADPWANDAIPNVDVEGIDVPDVDFSLEDAIYISGTVTDSLGNPIVNIPMEARDENGDFVGQTVGTADDGSYSVAVSASDSYYVWACPQCEWWDGSAEPYVNMYWDDADPWAEGAEPNIPVGTTHVVGKDFTLETPVYIHGTVLNSDGTAPLANIPIVARNENPRDVGDWVGTDDEGNFSLPVSPNKSYYVYAEPQNDWWDGSAEPYLNMYWNNIDPWADGAEPNIPVGTSDVFGKVFLLKDATYISGNVFMTGGITPIVNLHVDVQDSQTGNWVEGNNTDDTGFYNIPVPPGVYKVLACPSCGNEDGPLPYLNEYFNGVVGFDKATPVDTRPGNQGEIDFTLEDALFISGTVRDSSGAPLALIPMQAKYENGYEVLDSWVRTADDGSYSIAVPPQDSYYVLACPQCEWDGSTQPYLNMYWDDVDPSANGATANIHVDNDNVSGKDFTLRGGKYISGTVIDSRDSPLANIPVMAQDETVNDIAWAETDIDGNYSLLVASNDSYYVRACPQCDWGNDGVQPYVNMYWNNVDPWAEDAEPNIIVDNDNVPGKNFTLEDATIISGRVFEADGKTPIANFHVYVVEVSTGRYISGVNTDDTGFYSFGLAPGTYRVTACPSCSLQPYFEENIPDVDTSSDDQPNINFNLTSAAVISGTVEAATTSTPIANMPMGVWDSQTGQHAGGINTHDNGFYYIPVQAGTYRVSTCPSCGGLPYIDENYDNMFGSDHTPVTVTVGQDPGVFNFSLNLIVKGDINGDESVDLEDAIIGLKVTSGININENIFTTGTVDNNDKIGLPEVIYILDDVANP